MLSAFVFRLPVRTVLLTCLFFYLPYFQDYDNCKNWEMMHARMCEKLIRLYQDHKYIREVLSDFDKEHFDNIIKKDEHTIKNLLDYSLYDLSRWLKNYYKRKCIVLVDEYDHPLDIAYRNEYYEDARSFFAGIFSKLLKVSMYFDCLHRIVQIMT